MPDYKPPVKLVNEDGNAFAILARCRVAAEGSPINWSEFFHEATSGDYDHLLQTVMKYFDAR